MNIKWSKVAAMSIVPSFFVASAVSAAPYQFEVTGGYAQIETELIINGATLNGIPVPKGTTFDSDVYNAELTYYLQIVDTPSGPLAERAFMDKAAFINGSFNKRKRDAGEDIDAMGLDTRFVTDTDLIIELDYETTDDGSSTDDTEIKVGIGKYLDGQTTAVVSYEKEDGDSDDSIITGTYKKLTSNESTGTALSTELSLLYIDTDPDSGYGLIVDGNYYLSDTTSVGAKVDFEKIKDADVTIIEVEGSHFLTDTLFASVRYGQRKSDITKSPGIVFEIGARF